MVCADREHPTARLVVEPDADTGVPVVGQFIAHQGSDLPGRQQYASGDQLSLVLTDDTSTTVVTGTVSFEALEQFIGKLST